MSEEESDDEDEQEETGPAVELGEGPSVEGAPVARVASRLTWPLERSEVDRKEGETTIRTQDGPRELSSILESTDTSYYQTRQEFLAAVRDVVGAGPVQTE